MAVENLKSTSITNLDATPPVPNAAGAGAAGELRHINDFKVIPASTSVASIIRMCRVPTNAKVKAVVLESEAQAAGAFDVGLYYSSSTKDGTAAANVGAVLDADFFASAVSVASAVNPTDIVNESGVYTLDKRNQPLWQAAGLSADPGGYFDVALTCTTAVTTGTGRAGVAVRFCV